MVADFIYRVQVMVIAFGRFSSSRWGLIMLV